jgi:chloramphenicol-sensitive protein RarD
METLLMSPFALAYVLYADMNGMGSVGVLHGAEFWLLPACGVVTSIPLLFFNIGVKAIPYYVSGILMYINPTLQFVMGLFYFHEAMDWNRFVAFCLIWFGILFAVWDKARLILRDRQKNRGSRTEIVDNRA